MLCSTAFPLKSKSLFVLIPALLISICVAPLPARAQAYEKELSGSGKALFTIKNRTGRVSVIASDNEKDKSSFQATSTGAPVEAGDIIVSRNEITVRERPYRIDLTVHVPKRSRVRIESETGMIDVIGDFEVADVITNTGTIHADVPTDALKLKFEWASSRPRYLSDVELPKVKEGRGGAFSISGTIGPDAKRKKEKKKAKPEVSDPDKNQSDSTNPPANPAATPNFEKPDESKEPERQQLVRLNFLTQRGVILLNVDPSM